MVLLSSFVAIFVDGYDVRGLNPLVADTCVPGRMERGDRVFNYDSLLFLPPLPLVISVVDSLATITLPLISLSCFSRSLMLFVNPSLIL